MFRLANGTQVSALPTPPAAIGTPGFATAGIVGGQMPSIIDPDAFNVHQEELMAILAAAGLEEDRANHAQVLAAIQKLIATGISNATTPLYAWESSATLTIPAWSSRFGGWLTGAGGGGSGCYGKAIATDSLFGAGGGSAPTTYIVIDVLPTDTLEVVIGQGGAGAYGAANPGGAGTSSVLLKNGVPVLTCTGGGGGYWGNAVNSAGGAPGEVSCDLPCIVDNGGMGLNGQAGSFAFLGCGAPSFWGPGGTPSQNNVPVGPSFGSGGGGAFDANGTGNPFTGGAGAPGVLKGCFLP